MVQKSSKLWIKSLLLSSFMFMSIITTGHGNPNGAPSDACDDMTPGHDADTSTAASPFMITTDKRTYKNDEVVTITIEPIDESSSETFKGFLIVARKVSDANLKSSNSSSNIGQFSPVSVNGTTNAKLVECHRSGDAITHNNRKDKEFVSFEWVPDEGFKGEVIFMGTIVKDYDNFWIGVKSIRIVITK